MRRAAGAIGAATVALAAAAVACSAVGAAPSAAPRSEEKGGDPALAVKVTVAAQDRLLTDVLADMGRQASLKFEVRPYLQQAVVSMRARDLPARKVLDVLCSIHGWSYRKRGDTYVVAAIFVPPARREQSLAVRLLEAAPDELRPYLTQPELCERLQASYGEILPAEAEKDQRYREGKEIPFSELSTKGQQAYQAYMLSSVLLDLAKLVSKPMRSFVRWPDGNQVFMHQGRGAEKPTISVVGPDGDSVGWLYPWHRPPPKIYR